MFQSTLPRRERQFVKHQQFKITKFQSTLPRRERPGAFWHDLLLLLCFNPRSREGSDQAAVQYVRKSMVSIHAPAKGATRMMPVHSVPGLVSIHAPAKGATESCIITRNSREVSIHAPAKGATILKLN